MSFSAPVLRIQSRNYILLQNQNYIIGKQQSTDVDIPLQGEDVDEKHALLMVNTEGYIKVVDLRSKTGTILNNLKLSPVVIYDAERGSSIVFGSVKGLIGGSDLFTHNDDDVEILSLPDIHRSPAPSEHHDTFSLPDVNEMVVLNSDTDERTSDLLDFTIKGINKPRPSKRRRLEGGDAHAASPNKVARLFPSETETPSANLRVIRKRKPRKAGTSQPNDFSVTLRRSLRTRKLRIPNTDVFPIPTPTVSRRKIRKKRSKVAKLYANLVVDALQDDQPSTSAHALSVPTGSRELDDNQVESSSCASLIDSSEYNRFMDLRRRKQSRQLTGEVADASPHVLDYGGAGERRRFSEIPQSARTFSAVPEELVAAAATASFAPPVNAQEFITEVKHETAEVDLMSIFSRLSERQSTTDESVRSGSTQSGSLHVDDQHVNLFANQIYLVGRKVEPVGDLYIDISLDSARVDEKHAILEVCNNCVTYIIDLRSRYGTHVNGTKIRGLTRIKAHNRDTVTFGDKSGIVEVLMGTHESSV